MVECEYSSTYLSTVSQWVLIDTWWNVNKYTEDDLVYDGVVLIDTWWNVNLLM